MIYIHNNSVMVNFLTGDYTSDRIGLITLLRGGIVDAGDLIVINAKTDVEATPIVKNFVAGTYVISYLYGATRRNYTDNWNKGDGIPAGKMFIDTLRLSGYNGPIAGYATTLTAESVQAGNRTTHTLNGNHNLYCKSLSGEDNEGCVVYHIQKTA